MGTNKRCLWELASQKWSQAPEPRSSEASKSLAFCPQRQPLFFTRPPSRIVCIRGQCALLLRAFVGSLYIKINIPTYFRRSPLDLTEKYGFRQRAPLPGIRYPLKRFNWFESAPENAPRGLPQSKTNNHTTRVNSHRKNTRNHVKIVCQSAGLL